MRVDYSYWDTVEEFTSTQAAYLWVDEEPETKTGFRDARMSSISNRISQEVPSRNAGRYSTPLFFRGFGGDNDYGNDYGKQAYIRGTNYYHRDNLKKFAEKIGAKPAFLFPEKRPTPQEENPAPQNEKPATNDLSETERNNLLKQIGALACLLSEKSGDMKHGDNPNASKIAEEAGRKLEKNSPGINLHGLKTTLRNNITKGVKLLRES